MLSIRNLSKTYRNGVRALDDVSLEIPSGLFGLLGPNGAGKSTLMRTVATLQQADRGAISFDGIDVLSEGDRVRRLLGYVPQEFGLYPRVGAEAMLDHLAVLKGLDSKARRIERVHELLRLANLWDVRRRKLGTFSGGMKQRFGIAQALLAKPRLLIVDEPTAGLDPAERRRFLNLLGEIGDSVVVILSTHIVDDVQDVCATMAIIEAGRVRVTGAPAEQIARLEGRVWQAVLDRARAQQVGDRARVLSTRVAGDRSVVRILSEGSPPGGFEAVQPELSDVYFAALETQATSARV